MMNGRVLLFYCDLIRIKIAFINIFLELTYELQRRIGYDIQ